MVEILRNKNLATRFQILVEIARSGPNIQQRDIAGRLGITPQAISEYIKRLVKDGMLLAEGRSRYRTTSEGVNWIIKVLRELRGYDATIQQAITNISVSAAIAAIDIKKGQALGLEMKDGVLYATPKPGKGARGIAISDALAGADVGVSNIEGIVELKPGKVTILKVPSVQRGGSRKADLARLRREVMNTAIVGAIGIEAIAALKQVDDGAAYLYGVTEAAIEAVRSGLNTVIACVDDAAPGLISRLEAENISYELIDLRRR
jgi:putative transcriptional regulator